MTESVLLSSQSDVSFGTQNEEREKARGQFLVSFESPERFASYLLLLQYGFFFYRSLAESLEAQPRQENCPQDDRLERLYCRKVSRHTAGGIPP